eukprot:Amastigsp_a664_855.p2 type:complete len:318 gc:universal Amastigsp_a664_855:99-1052(+)
MKSSMRRIVIAASVANLMALTLAIAGSTTPARRLLRTEPPKRSRPVIARLGSPPGICAELCAARSCATRSIESFAELMARVLGMTRSDSANAAIATCSRDEIDVAYFSRVIDSAVSTAPPPGTTFFDSSTRLMTQSASWTERSISSSMSSLAPRRMIDEARFAAHSRTMITSSSQTRSTSTTPACPRSAGSKTSSPSMFPSERQIVPPQALAMRFMSVFLTRRTAIAPASTKYLRQRSSMPPVVRMTLAPVARILAMRSCVILASLSCMLVISSGSVISTWNWSGRRTFWRLKSKNAILAPVSRLGICCEPSAQLRA